MATKSEERLPVGPIGRFVPCPANGNSHPECFALEVKRTYDKNGKLRYSAHCGFCNSRIFLNNWAPGPKSRTIVMAEREGLHPLAVTPERKALMLKELGLVQAPGYIQAPAAWPVALPPPVYVQPQRLPMSSRSRP